MYLIKESITKNSNNNFDRQFKAKYFLYAGKWKVDTIYFDRNLLKDGKKCKKFNYNCIKI